MGFGLTSALFGKKPKRSAAQQAVKAMPQNVLNLANRGGLDVSRSSQSQQAQDLLTRAGQTGNQLNPIAMSAAQGFLRGPQVGNNPYLQKSLDAQTQRTIEQITPSTQTQFAMAGRGGSLDERGTIADRVASAMAPVNAQALAGDFARQQELQYNTMLNAPTLGAAPGQQLAQQAQYSSAAGEMAENEQLRDWQNMQRRNQAITGVTPVYTGQRSGGVLPILAGAAKGFATGGIPGAVAGGFGSWAQQKAMM